MRDRARTLAQVDEFETTIERLLEGGDGLARVDGIPIFVSRAAPGDRVRALIVQRRRDYGRAEIVEILEPGPQRESPRCPVYESCGGCDLQHVADTQLEQKVEAALETLRRLGGVNVRDPEIVSGPSWGYRTRAQFHVARPQSDGSEEGAEDTQEDGQQGAVPAPSALSASRDEPLQIGFYRRGSRDVVPIEHCPVLDPRLNTFLAELPRSLEDLDRVPERIDVTLGDDGLAVAPRLGELPSRAVSRRVGSYHLEYDARCFFQGNASLLEQLVDKVVARDEGGEAAWDLYAGVGLFATALAKHYQKVTAVETDRIAARYARRNARRNRLANIEVEAQSVDGFLQQRTDVPDLVVADPPRGGLSKGALRDLVRLRPRRVVYVSCQAPTLARDLRTLTRHYEVRRLSFVDLFPQTAHLEAVTHLHRLEAS